MKTLQDILQESDTVGIKDSLAQVVKFLESKDTEQLDTLVALLQKSVAMNDEWAAMNKALLSSAAETNRLLQSILGRPDPAFPAYPEPKEFPALPAYPEPKDVSPLLEELIERTGNEARATREVLNDILNSRADGETPQEEKKDGKFPLNIGSIRRHSRWQIATIPNLPGTAAITAKGDGLTFYLPFQPIKFSETIRLNGGLPLSQGVDYTLTGNQLVFTQNQTGSQIEMRAQN